MISNTIYKTFEEVEPDKNKTEKIWGKLGKELGWEPFTLALYYVEYLEKNKKS